MTPHTAELNGAIERRFPFIKERVLAVLFNAKLNHKNQKIMWSEAVHTCECAKNSMANTGSMKIPFENFYEKTILLVCYRGLCVLRTS